MSGPSNPLHTLITQAPGAWLDNFAAYPWMWIAPVLGLLGPVLAMIGLKCGWGAAALGGSAGSALGVISTVGLSMFPILLPSSVDSHSGLTVWNASSSQTTLFNMLVATVIFLPIVLVYTSWVFKVLWGRSDTRAILASPDYY